MAEIRTLPAVFATETSGSGDRLARVGYIHRVTAVGRDVRIEYAFYPDLPPISHDEFKSLAADLQISSFEFSRTHWAIKDVDLFKVLHTKRIGRPLSPTVFSFADLGRPEGDLISVMMPFASQFDRVYDALKAVASTLSLKCLRADDFWEHAAVIQDVVALICRSRIVVCDCSGRNPNVFYEAGIAHSLGKDVILIAQSADDIPFDLRHLRYVTYLNNGEGLQQLQAALQPKINQLMGL
jgi:hypothetical protein